MTVSMQVFYAKNYEAAGLFISQHVAIHIKNITKACIARICGRTCMHSYSPTEVQQIWSIIYSNTYYAISIFRISLPKFGRRRFNINHKLSCIFNSEIDKTGLVIVPYSKLRRWAICDIDEAFCWTKSVLQTVRWDLERYNSISKVNFYISHHVFVPLI